MGLASALSTALTGLGAAEATIDVVGNNVANSNTVGFKASSASFATQFLQTRSLGSAPTETRGGTNPRQVGLGVTVAEITPDFTQGTIQVSSNPSDLAIQGDGFFMIEGTGGERLYTRNGIFKTNSENELVTISGQRLLGHGVDENFVIQPTTLQPLTIPLGAKSVAQATQNAYMVGTLSPTGDVASAAEIIQSGFLSDGSVEVPENLPPGSVSASAPPTVQNSGTTAVSVTAAANSFVPAGATGGTLAAGTYHYKIVHVTSTGLEGVPSPTVTGTVGVGENAVSLGSLPVVPSGFSGTRVYRSATGAAGSFVQVGATLPAGTPSFLDTNGPTGATLIEGTGLPAPPVGNDVYNYKIVFVDDDGNVGPPATIPGTVDGTTNNRRVHLTNLPLASGEYTSKRIYRSTTDAGGTAGGPYELVGTIPASQASFVDTGIPAGGAPLTETALDPGNYGYYVTFYSSSESIESRPTALVGPQSLSTNGSRIRLENLPQPTGGTWDSIRIYRNLANDTETFYQVGSVGLGNETFMDGTPDSAVDTDDQFRLNLEGPSINFGTRLVDIVQRDGTNYENMFPGGTLSFSGLKGGQRLGAKEFEVTGDATVQDLLEFMRESMGVITQSGDSVNPLPLSADLLTADPTDTANPGGDVVFDSFGRSRLQLVGNNGERNAIKIDLSSIKLTQGNETESVNLNFSSVQEAVGESAAADFIAYDSLGIPISVRVNTVLESRDSSTTTYRWFADSPQNDPSSGTQTNVGTGLIRFDGEGNLVSVTNSTVAVQRQNVSSTSPLQFNLDFSQVSGLATEKSELNTDRQDGFGTGTLSSFIIGEEGRIRGVFTNGTSRDLGQIRLARFANAAGLQAKGENAFAAGVNSGLPIEGDPGQQGIGTIVAGATEQSNTDIGKNLIDLILASTQYRGNTRVITAAQQLLDELMNLRR
jgi:flagellar hook protein FlgE